MRIEALRRFSAPLKQQRRRGVFNVLTASAVAVLDTRASRGPGAENLRSWEIHWAHAVIRAARAANDAGAFLTMNRDKAAAFVHSLAEIEFLPMDPRTSKRWLR